MRRPALVPTARQQHEQKDIKGSSGSSSSSSTDSSNIVKKKREKKVKKKQKRKGGQNLRWSTLQAKVDKTCAGLRFKRYCKVKGETAGTPYGVLGSKAKNA